MSRYTVISEGPFNAGAHPLYLRESVGPWFTLPDGTGTREHIIELGCRTCKATQMFLSLAEWNQTNPVEIPGCQCRAHADTMRQFPPAA